MRDLLGRLVAGGLGRGDSGECCRALVRAQVVESEFEFEGCEGMVEEGGSDVDLDVDLKNGFLERDGEADGLVDDVGLFCLRFIWTVARGIAMRITFAVTKIVDRFIGPNIAFRFLSKGWRCSK